MQYTKFIIFSIVLQCAVIPAAMGDDWVTIVAVEDGPSLELKSKSLEYEKTVGGTVVAMMTVRMTASRQIIMLRKWYVSANDCAKEQGRIVVVNIFGEYMYESDFVFGGGNINSFIAELICDIAILPPLS
jgi:hypothetical protein